VNGYSFATSRSLPKLARLNDIVRIGDDAIGVADILSIRVSSSAQVLLLCPSWPRVLVNTLLLDRPSQVSCSLITMPARTVKAKPVDLLVVERGALQIVVEYLTLTCMVSYGWRETRLLTLWVPKTR
jgi:hypothetical protein